MTPNNIQRKKRTGDLPLQIAEVPLIADGETEGHFLSLTSTARTSFSTQGTLQMLDDCGRSLTFAKANIYDDAKIVLHKDRVLRHIVLPYQQVRSSRTYSWYQRL